MAIASDNMVGVVLKGIFDPASVALEHELFQFQKRLVQLQHELGFDEFIPFVLESESGLTEVHIVPVSSNAGTQMGNAAKSSRSHQDLIDAVIARARSPQAAWTKMLGTSPMPRAVAVTVAVMDPKTEGGADAKTSAPASDKVVPERSAAPVWNPPIARRV